MSFDDWWLSLIVRRGCVVVKLETVVMLEVDLHGVFGCVEVAGSRSSETGSLKVGSGGRN